jgi:hypothetical protein
MLLFLIHLSSGDVQDPCSRSLPAIWVNRLRASVSQKCYIPVIKEWLMGEDRRIILGCFFCRFLAVVFEPLLERFFGVMSRMLLPP